MRFYPKTGTTLLISILVACLLFFGRNKTSSTSDAARGYMKNATKENPTIQKTENFNFLETMRSKVTSSNYKKILTGLNLQHVPANNPTLIEIIRKYYLEPPSRKPYNLENPKRRDHSYGQAPFVDSRLNYMEGGFFIECGALNGEKGSNTLFFEKVRKWNGLLIEADPANYADLKTKHRKAFTINACLSPRKSPAQLPFNPAFNLGRLIHDSASDNWVKRLKTKKSPIRVQCFPVYSLLLALNRTTVDFFSLDVEGDEVTILKTIPFEKINIKMLSVECVHGSQGPGHLQSFMHSRGYETLLKLQRDDGGVNDMIFRKKGLTH